jgi:hypothetical protein
MMTLECGVVANIIQEDDTVQILYVDLNGLVEKAINYKDIYGRIEIGQKVWLNTTAVRLKLGSGGFHFVLWHDAMHAVKMYGDGHIMKLPYTPWQFGCLSVEEDDSAYHSAFTRECTLDGMPVIICELHSMLAPTAAVLKYIGFDTLAYIMTDRACLPIAFSDTVKELRRKELLDYTITVGNAFGGDYEAVNLYTALITAHRIARADAAIVAIGPGIIGTGTVYGFSTLEQGHYIDDVNALSGRAIFMPRISFADPRSRHIGISHHSLTALSLAAHTQAEVYIPILPKKQMRMVISQIEGGNLLNKHRWRFRDGSCIRDIMERYGLHVTTMGRSYNDDPAFFKVAGALKNI